MTQTWLLRTAAFMARAGLLRPLAEATTAVRFVVRGESMEPAFSGGDYLLVSRLALLLRAPDRGAVVVVRADWGAGPEYLKRIVGLPGERVQYKDGQLFIGGGAVPEPYLRLPPIPLDEPPLSWTLGDGDYLVFGDNRHRSADSRHHGPVPRSALVGVAYFRYWPLSATGRLGTA